MKADVPEYLGPALTAVIVPLVLAWLLRGARRTARVKERRLVVEYGWGPRGFALVFALIPVAAAMAAPFVGAGGRSNALFIAGFFGALIAPLVLEFFRVRIEFDDAEIRCFSPWRKNRVIPWSAVESITFSAINSWWIAHTRAHGRIRLHQLISGAADFIAAAKARGIGVDGPLPAPPVQP